MHAFEFLRSPSKVGARPIYAVSGDDAYLRDESLKVIARQALGEGADDLSVSRIPGDQASLSDVLDELRTLPFLAKCRVVIVDGADAFVASHRKGLESYAEKPASSGVLVLSVKSWPGNTRLAKLVEKAGLSIDCKAPDERELPAWLAQFAKNRSKAKLEDDAARLLVELVGPEVGLLVSEVEKLAVYVGEKQPISREDVSRMVGAGAVEKIFGIVDAATTGRGAEALARPRPPGRVGRAPDQDHRRHDVLPPEAPPLRPVASGALRVEGCLPAGRDLPGRGREDGPPACPPRPQSRRPIARDAPPGRSRPQRRIAPPPQGHPRTPPLPTVQPPARLNLTPRTQP